MNQNSNQDIPKIYVYTENTELSDPNSIQELKVGYTTRSAEERVKEQYAQTQHGKKKYKIIFQTQAIKNDGSPFKDTDVHRILEENGFRRIRTEDGNRTEWFKCRLKDVEHAIIVIKTGNKNLSIDRTQNFKPRPDQQEAIKVTSNYFKKSYIEDPDTPSHFLWNAKMRFGKTFTAYKLAQEMKWKRLLILTFKPAVKDSWKKDLNKHIDFDGWQFVDSKNNFDNDVKNLDLNSPIVCFGSFQDFLGTTKEGRIKPKNEWVHKMSWDCVILDEYHFGSWRDRAKDLFDRSKELFESEAEELKENENYYKTLTSFDEKRLPIKTKHYLYLSGTPFRAINTGEFIEEQIFNWTYIDEQRAKNNWRGTPESNPYSSLPQIQILCYELPQSIKDQIHQGTVENGFDLNEFFSATGKKDKAKFKYENDVQKWLDFIRGGDVGSLYKKINLPFYTSTLKEKLNHTFWFLPSVSSCYAMKNLLQKDNNTFYHDYSILVVAGSEVGTGEKALSPVEEAIGNSNEAKNTKTITLSCGKLTTGVSVPGWTGIFMLRNLQSSETYFQAAFRVQTPWFIKNPTGQNPNEIDIIKKTCYVFDFAPNRTLSQIANLNNTSTSSENTVSKEDTIKELLDFLPVLCYDGSSMEVMDAEKILDISFSGTTHTLLARKWMADSLINISYDILKKLLKDESLMNILMSIEGFRSLNDDLNTIINKQEALDDLKKQSVLDESNSNNEQDKKINEKTKELRNKKEELKEKLKKLLTRIPVFMYLTDEREKCLKDVILDIEPKLFKRVTGLDKKDFKKLLDLNLFHKESINNAIYYFRKYENSSLEYSGINKHEGETHIGGFDTVKEVSGL